jgi:hypothetical protein
MSTVQPTVLTKEHIHFIRKANKSIVFRYIQGRQSIEIENEIGAELKIDAGFYYRGYGNTEPGTPEREPHKAFDMIHTPSWDQPWQTVIALLKPGDTLNVRWLANTNGYVERATFAGDKDCESFNALHMDQVFVEIVRGKQVLTFAVGLSVCPQNSARMFQY